MGKLIIHVIKKRPFLTFSSLIPPAITGLHNGDTVKAFMDNGIKYVVGDNTRPALMNTVSVILAGRYMVFILIPT